MPSFNKRDTVLEEGAVSLIKHPIRELVVLRSHIIRKIYVCTFYAHAHIKFCTRIIQLMWTTYTLYRMQQLNQWRPTGVTSHSYLPRHADLMVYADWVECEWSHSHYLDSPILLSSFFSPCKVHIVITPIWCKFHCASNLHMRKWGYSCQRNFMRFWVAADLLLLQTREVTIDTRTSPLMIWKGVDLAWKSTPLHYAHWHRFVFTSSS